MHEGIPILNFLVPKEFVIRDGKLSGMTFEKVKAVYDDKGRRSLVPTGEPDQFFECDDVLVAVGQENAFPWIERDAGIEFDKWGLPVLDKVTFQSTVPNVFFGGDSAFGPKNIIWAVAHGHDAAVSIDKLLNKEDVERAARARRHAHVAEDGHPRVELRQRDRDRPALQGALGRHQGHAQEREDGGRARLRRRHGVEGGAALPQLRRADGVHRQAVHRVRRLRRHLPDGLHHLHAERREKACEKLNAPANNLTQDLYVSGPLKTQRVMVKDEDVCLHCGLCAERCPTGAWDMQKFLVEMTYAGIGLPSYQQKKAA